MHLLQSDQLLELIGNVFALFVIPILFMLVIIGLLVLVVRYLVHDQVDFVVAVVNMQRFEVDVSWVGVDDGRG